MASAADLLMEVGDPGTATTLSAPGYTAGGTSINVGSTTNWPTSTGVVFAIDEAEVVGGEEVQVAGTYNEFVGTVDTGTSIANVDWVRGVGDRNYSAGALTRVYIPVSAERENRIVEWGLVHADQDGTLKAGAVDVSAVLADSVVSTAKIATDAVTAEKIDWASTGANGGIWWEELGRTTLGSAGDTITVNFTAKKYLKILVTCLNSGSIDIFVRFNNDSSANYSERKADNGGADASLLSATAFDTLVGVSSYPVFFTIEMNNIANYDKLGIMEMVGQNTAGSGNNPVRKEAVYKWSNTTTQVNRIDVYNVSTGDLAIGSEVIVLGHD